MKEIKGHKYSREEFEDYKYRVKFRFSVSEDWREDSTLDIYTTCQDKKEIVDVIESLKKDKVIKCVAENFSTKEQDVKIDLLLEEILKNL